MGESVRCSLLFYPSWESRGERIPPSPPYISVPSACTVHPTSAQPMCGVLCNEPKWTKLMWINPSKSGISGKIYCDTNAHQIHTTARQHDTRPVIISYKYTFWCSLCAIGQQPPSIPAKMNRLYANVLIQLELTKCHAKRIHFGLHWLSLVGGRQWRNNLVRFFVSLSANWFSRLSAIFLLLFSSNLTMGDRCGECNICYF